MGALVLTKSMQTVAFSGTTKECKWIRKRATRKSKKNSARENFVIFCFFRAGCAGMTACGLIWLNAIRCDVMPLN